MDDALTLYVDGIPRLQVTRRGGVPGQLRALFARLDADMDGGIELEGRVISDPDVAQKGHFVLGRMLAALEAGQSDLAHTLLIYVATQLPELRAVRVIEEGASWTAELDFH